MYPYVYSPIVIILECINKMISNLPNKIYDDPCEESEVMKEDLKRYRLTQQELLFEIEGRSEKIAQVKKTLLDLSKTQENWNKQIILQDKKIQFTNLTIKNLSSQLNQLDQQFKSKSDKKILLEKQLSDNFQSKINIDMAYSIEQPLSDDIIDLRVRIEVLNSTIRQEEERYLKEIRNMTVEYEKRVRDKRMETKMAQILERFQSRKILIQLNQNPLVTREKIQDDLIAISKINENIRQNIIKTVNSSKKIHSPYTPSSQHYHNYFAIRYILLISIGYLIGNIYLTLYSRFNV